MREGGRKRKREKEKEKERQRERPMDRERETVRVRKVHFSIHLSESPDRLHEPAAGEAQSPLISRRCSAVSATGVGLLDGDGGAAQKGLEKSPAESERESEGRQRVSDGEE
jgi:hypothetical protein